MNDVTVASLGGMTRAMRELEPAKRADSVAGHQRARIGTCEP